MKRSTVLIVALAAVVLTPVPAVAQADTADHTIAAPLFEPAPAEQMKPNKCTGQEELLTMTFDWLFQDPADCEPHCVSYCDDNGGRLLSAQYFSRDLTCNCSCCVPR